MPRTTDVPISLYVVFDLISASSKGFSRYQVTPRQMGKECRLNAARRECSRYRRAMDRRRNSTQLRPFDEVVKLELLQAEPPARVDLDNAASTSALTAQSGPEELPPFGGCTRDGTS